MREVLVRSRKAFAAVMGFLLLMWVTCGTALYFSRAIFFTIFELASVLAVIHTLYVYISGEREVVRDEKLIRVKNERCAQTLGAGELVQIVRELSGKVSLVCPRIYVLPEKKVSGGSFGMDVPFGRAVEATEGALKLNINQLRALMAHEVAHLKNQDMLVNRALGLMAVFFLFLAFVLSPTLLLACVFGGFFDVLTAAVVIGVLVIMNIISEMITLVSRQREFAADALGVQLAGSVEPMIEVLEIIVGEHSGAMPDKVSESHEHPTLEVIRGQTHPPTRKRINALKNLKVEI